MSRGGKGHQLTDGGLVTIVKRRGRERGKGTELLVAALDAAKGAARGAVLFGRPPRAGEAAGMEAV